ncbi:hypothetical protein [Streptomyces sp. SID5606]|uniref:hypothetical protein n=1 Tax=Streptomyces sp. SID5606 TaxID=2690305 RepID=UPI001F3EEFA2|nr:hypothetical protein [Streptomyces sp. SID5606]
MLYEADHFTEYVYRQPRTAEELADLVEAAEAEAFGGYGCDGDAHWTPAAVREWWRDRGRIREYLAGRRADWEADDAKAGQGVAAPLRGTPRTSTASWPATFASISSGSRSDAPPHLRTGCHSSEGVTRHSGLSWPPGGREPFAEGAANASGSASARAYRLRVWVG